MRSATRVVASTLGILAGLSGMDHGYFETLQGNVAPSGIMISAIGQANRFWQGGTEPAMTIIPNFFVTGVLAIIVSLIVMIWAAALVQRKNGGVVLIILSIMQLLVGGGIAPVFLGIIAGVTATKINAPLTWWRAHLSVNLRRLLAKLLPWSLIAFLLLYFVLTEIAIFGHFFGVNNPINLLLILSYFSLGLILLAVFAGFAYDIQHSDRNEHKGDR